MGTHTAPVPQVLRGRATLTPGRLSVWMGYSILWKPKVLIEAVTSSRAHLDDDQAFAGAQFVGNCADDFLHRGGHWHPNGCVGVVQAVDFKQNCWEGRNNMVNLSWEFLGKPSARGNVWLTSQICTISSLSGLSAHLLPKLLAFTLV